MQGERVESSVIEALDAILYETEVWDAVVIIRGGGATTDLHGFDSYLLAANVAQYPLPVLTGIGHERDDTIVDLVAHTRLKTPTAVAAFLIESRRNESDLLSALVERFRQALTARIDEEALRIDDCRKRLEIVSVRLSSLRRERLAAVVRRLELASLRTLADRRAARERLVGRLRYATLRRLQTAEGEVALLDRRLPAAATGNVDRGRSRLEYLSGIVRLSDPAHILAKGYSVTLKDGRPVRSASELALGDLVTMRYMCGTAESRITQISISTPDA